MLVVLQPETCLDLNAELWLPKLSSLRVRRRIVERNMLTINTRGQSNKNKADCLP